MNQVTRIARRYKALLSLNRITLSTFSLGEIFRGMCAVLRTMLAYDRAGLAIYDPDQDSLKIEAIYGSHENSHFQVGYEMPRNSSPAFEHRTPIIRRDLEKDFRTPEEKHIMDEGCRSLCSVPLFVCDDTIGVVTVVSTRKNRFSVRDSQLVQEMSDQITMAILSRIPRCPFHPNTKLFCPRCIGATGGKTTVLKHREDLSNWGKKGGRGRKKQVS